MAFYERRTKSPFTGSRNSLSVYSNKENSRKKRPASTQDRASRSRSKEKDLRMVRSATFTNMSDNGNNVAATIEALSKNQQLLQPLPPKKYKDPKALHQPGTGFSIQDWVKMIQERGTKGLAADFKTIRQLPPTSTFKAYQSFRDKNRYQDVLCYDQSRVKLTDGLGENYIHANFLDGYKQRSKYICTQGPTKNTFLDFWRMVWQEQTLVIVMLTQVSEGGKEKCGQYWPLSQRKSVQLAPFVISLKKIIRDKEYDVSFLSIYHQLLNRERLICHVLYHAWPDFQVPESAGTCLRFLHFVQSLQATQVKLMVPRWKGHSNGPPIVIHCSAGIGRTGTLCTIDICLAKFEDTSKIDVADVVRKIRTQRMHSIQTAEQYIFVHKAILECIAEQGLVKVPHLDLSYSKEDNKNA